MKLSLAIFALLICSISLQAQSGITFFEGTFAEAKTQAAKENKAIFLDAYTVWCGPCKWMEKNTFTDQAVADYYNSNFINVKMDMEKGEGIALARKYRVMAYPTLLFIKSDGTVLGQKMGAKDAKNFLAIGKQINSSL